MPVTNPVENTYHPSTPQPQSTGSTAHSIPHPPPISLTRHTISGLKTHIYGLSELSPTSTQITTLWLLHPRLQTQECMAPFAAHLIHAWNSRPSSKSTGLIAVSFDQRNHGTREMSSIANEAWRGGNERHAMDMFSCYHGTAVDTSQLLDHLPAYLFPGSGDERRIVRNIVLGISLGAHAAWHVLLQDARFEAAIIVIGCPDYAKLMWDRARLSKRRSWVDTQGKHFIGSEDFPEGLCDAVRRFDPAGYFFGPEAVRLRKDELRDEDARISVDEVERIFEGRRILNLSGGADKLVPYRMGEPFLRWLKGKAESGGIGLVFEDVVVENVGHEVPPVMVERMERFLVQTLEGGDVGDGGRLEKERSRKDSRI